MSIIVNIKLGGGHKIGSSLAHRQQEIQSYLIFVVFGTPPYLLALKKVRQKSVRICDKNCLASKQRKFLVGVLGILVLVLDILLAYLVFSWRN